MPTTLKTYSFLILIASLFFCACGHNDTSPVPRFSALRNGQAWEDDASNLKATLKNGQFRISPFICGIDLWFDGDTPGIYPTGRDQYNFAVAHDQTCGELFFTNLEDLNTGVLEITRVDKDRKLIDGKFSFTAKNKSGATTVTFEDGIFEDISYTEEPSNSDKKAMHAWIEEDGKKYALNYLSYNNYYFTGATSSETKIVTLILPGSSYVAGTYDLTTNGTPDGNPHLVYNLTHGVLDVTFYEPTPGSKFNMIIPAGSVTSFLGSFDVNLVKNGGVGPDNLQLKAELEVREE